jgi:hypothetical protein
MSKILPGLLEEFHLEAAIGTRIVGLDGIEQCDMRLVNAADEVG